MNDEAEARLHQAARAVLDRWDSPAWKWENTAALMADLRAALAIAKEERGEVDLHWASNRAREVADQTITNCYLPQHRDGQVARAHWADAFQQEFDALTKPSPRRV